MPVMLNSAAVSFPASVVPFENLRDWICRTFILKTKTGLPQAASPPKKIKAGLQAGW